MGRLPDFGASIGYLALAIILQLVFFFIGGLVVVLGSLGETSPIALVIVIVMGELAFAVTAYLVLRDDRFTLLNRTVTSASTGYLVGGPLLAIVVGLGLTFGLRQFGFAGEKLVGAQQMVGTSTRVLLMVISFVVIAPAEELFFRGALQGRLRNSFGLVGTVGIASILFVLVHIPNVLSAALPVAAAGLTGVTIFSVLAGVAYERTKSIIVPIIMHGAYNAIIFALPIFVSF